MNIGADVRGVPPAVSVPALVLHPVDDPTFLIDEGRYMAARIPGAEMVELPGNDHGRWVRSHEIGFNRARGR
jgi:pimeloyl-ACP methyl ester carboxylesterase